MTRQARIHRKTLETDISLELILESNEESNIDSGIPFLDHMLSHVVKHGRLCLKLKCTGDLEIDGHHSVEDIGISLGEALKEALGDRKGIRRYGHFSLPMEEALANVALDLSNRPHLVYHTPLSTEKIGDFDVELIKEFFRALTLNAGITLHINVPYGENLHHMAEGIFKSFGHALKEAVSIDPHIKGVLSTKGII
ncbi:MAG TPA: imidazoleglycerol-phosphate dehydratase HisB [Spirochaetes bacterium]|nr:imidazoleglycerol-phosphate dehydratase HisB [Spirochaetota bacterium]